jgi:hypothetical protein
MEEKGDLGLLDSEKKKRNCSPMLPHIEQSITIAVTVTITMMATE